MLSPGTALGGRSRRRPKALSPVLITWGAFVESHKKGYSFLNPLNNFKSKPCSRLFFRVAEPKLKKLGGARIVISLWVSLESFFGQHFPRLVCVCLLWHTIEMAAVSETLVKAPRNANVFPVVSSCLHRSKITFALQMIIVVLNKVSLRSLRVQRVLLLLCG